MPVIDTWSIYPSPPRKKKWQLRPRRFSFRRSTAGPSCGWRFPRNENREEGHTVIAAGRNDARGGWWLIYPWYASAGAGWRVRGAEREARGSEENVLVTRIRLAPGHNLWTSSPGNALCEFLYRDPSLSLSLSSAPISSFGWMYLLFLFWEGRERWRER